MARKHGVKSQKTGARNTGIQETVPQETVAQKSLVQESPAQETWSGGGAELADAGRSTVRPILATSVVAAIILLIAAVSIWTG